MGQTIGMTRDHHLVNLQGQVLAEVRDGKVYRGGGANSFDKIKKACTLSWMKLFPAFMAILYAACYATATDIYLTDFNNYGQGSLSGQLAWVGVGGSWAVSGSMNTPQIAANLIGPGVDSGVAPIGGSGLMTRICTEKFNAGRTKAWLDLANSGKWATASAGGNNVLETTVKLFIPSGQAVTSTFGIMISKSSFETSGGFVVSAQTGAISLLNGGYAIANRTATGITVALNAWNNFSYRWDVATGRGELRVNGASAGTHQTTLFGSLYASNLFSTTDAAPGTLNAFGYFDDLAIRAVANLVPCPADISGDGQVNANDLASVLAGWGGPAGDLDGNGVTDGLDLSTILGGWGPCPN